jgi:tRNA/tmRNA/rRNA uracil-C5-methylase (TrmA/RlmC/RlmD family)
VRHVVKLLPPGTLVDLYAGVGLFGVSALAAGASDVTMVEGDAVSSADLHSNAEPFGARARVSHASVETYLRSAPARRDAVFVVDPPRTGMSREAVSGVIARAPARIVYVSCDVATLARDVRTFVDGGYELEGLTGFDLFPNTAHVETVAALVHS